MNVRIGLFGDSLEGSAVEHQGNRVTALAAAWIAYKFLFQHFWSIVRLALLPIAAAGLVLYLSLSFYLSELLLFLGTSDPRVASLALGTLAAGLFVSLFCYAIAVVSVTDLALGKPPQGAWLRVRVERQAWRVYAAYLRFLLLLSVVLACAFLLSVYVAPVVMIADELFSWGLTVLTVAGIYWLFARIGFLVAPIVAACEGPVLRRAKQESAQDLWRNCGLIALLLLPGFLVQIAGEYALRIGTGTPVVGSNLPLADSARLMGQMLGGFLAVVSLSLFVSIVLLTVGAIAVYRTMRVREAPANDAKQPAAGSSLGCSVPAEGLPE